MHSLCAKGGVMDTKVNGVSRWKVVVGIIAALLVGGVAGSLYTVNAGKAAAGSVPLWLAASSPVPTDQVSFASGFAAVAAKNVPSVVNIASTKIIRSRQGETAPFFSDPFFRQFFGNQFPQIPRERREESLGSGVIVSPEGYILTNNHVVEGAKEIKITLGNKNEYDAKVIGTDSRTDIAVLKIEDKGLPAIPFGDSSKVKVGEFALAIGNPFGLSQTVTMGIISATGRGGLGIEDYEDFIQTDASINPGNSGGALVNVNGELVGINTAIVSGGSGGNQGVGFAIPVNMARAVMEQILKQGKVIRGYLGAWIQPVTPEIAKAFGLSKPEGALLGDVEPGTPAARAGLERGDIVVALNGEPVTDTSQFRLKIAMTAPGTKVRLKVMRGSAEKEVDVVLGEQPAQKAESRPEQEQPSAALQGLDVDNLTPQIARQLDLPAGMQGVVVSGVEQGSAAEEAGLQRGDVILEVNRNPVHNVNEFSRAVNRLGKQSVLLLVYSNGSTRYVVVEPF
jgi:serine protease Do